MVTSWGGNTVLRVAYVRIALQPLFLQLCNIYWSTYSKIQEAQASSLSELFSFLVVRYAEPSELIDLLKA